MSVGMTRETALHVRNSLNMEPIRLYVNDRIQELHTRMEFQKDYQMLSEHQGAIAELKRLLTIQTLAEGVLRQELTNGHNRTG